MAPHYDDAFLFGYAIDAYVEEAADDDAVEKYDDGEDNSFHGVSLTG
jgi:hypothetical protein